MSAKEISSSPHSSPLTSYSSSFCRKKSIRPKLFRWNRELPRQNSEYLNGKFDEAFNKVSPELKTIGGLGRIRCVERRQRILNRPTQVQKLSHTKTKMLPNFPLTAQLRPVVCTQEQQPKSVFEHAERVKFAENLIPSTATSTSSSSSLSEDKMEKRFNNHDNPFNLDIKGLSEYQRQKSVKEDVERRKKYQIIRRAMETKLLKTEGRERIKQQERDEKFGLPKLFKVEDDEKEEEEMRAASSFTSIKTAAAAGCRAVAMMDKANVKEISQLHYREKENKLHRQVKEESSLREKVEIEEMKKSKEDEENFIFNLADASLPPSEYNDEEQILQTRLKTFPPAFQRFDYPVSELEFLELKRKLNAVQKLDEMRGERLITELRGNEEEEEEEEAGLACGQKVGNRVILRSFHDRLYSEPRGKRNLYEKQASETATCQTHKQWLHTISNDLQITREPPRVKLISCLKASREPNDDKTILFERIDNNDDTEKKIDLASMSPIKHYTRQIDQKLKQRYRTTKIKKSKEASKKQLQRMNFMGIPISYTTDATKQCSRRDIESIVAKISQTTLRSNEKSTILAAATSKERVVTTRDGGVKFSPRIPQFKNETMAKGDKKCKENFRFTKAQPQQGNNSRNDKSLPSPWMDGTTAAVMQTFEIKGNDLDEGIEDENIVQSSKRASRESQQRSAIKKSFNEIIARKLQDYKPDVVDAKEEEEEDKSEEKVQQSIESLSSAGTYFSQDSGSYLMIHEEKIPKSQLNISKKFQNRSLVTTQEQPPYEKFPYFVGDTNLMKLLKKAPDRFHTHRTRSCFGIRERVKVESPAYEDELIGDNELKYPSQLAADFDDSYVKEFYNHRSRNQYRFLPKTEISQLRDTLRKKMDIFYIQEKIILDEIHNQKEEKTIENLQATLDAYFKFLNICQETTHRKSMRVVEQVKNYYQITDKLQSTQESLNSQIEPLKMKIFYHANEYVQRIMYRDVQYLLKPIEWRQLYDNLHRTSEGELENFRISIEQRGTRNLWNRDCVSVATIMNFINAKSGHQESIEKLFESGSDLLKAYKSLQSKSFKVLEKFTYAAMKLEKLKHEMKMADEQSEKLVSQYENSSSFVRQSFMQSRFDEVKSKAKILMGKPLEESFGAPLLRDVTALCSHLFEDKLAGDGSAKYFTATEKFALIEKKVLKFFSLLDEIPREQIDAIDKRTRALWKKKLRISERAYRIELNIDFTMTQLERLLAKPEHKMKKKRKGKLPRSVLPTRPPKPIKILPLLTSIEEKYFKAFMELEGRDSTNIKFDENVKQTIQKIKNESVPFYLDYFLEKRGFKIGKLNELQCEDILKSEEALLKHKDVIPVIRKQVKLWEDASERDKERNIQRTAYLYEKKK